MRKCIQIKLECVEESAKQLGREHLNTKVSEDNVIAFPDNFLRN